MVSYPFTQKLGQRYMYSMSGDYLSSEMFPSSLVIQPQQQRQHLTHSRKQKYTKSSTGKVGLTQDVTKTFDSCPSKSDGEMLPSRFGI